MYFFRTTKHILVTIIVPCTIALVSVLLIK